jgi:hypothetical protein
LIRAPKRPLATLHLIKLCVGCDSVHPDD